jgi:hypothetical protein
MVKSKNTYSRAKSSFIVDTKIDQKPPEKKKKFKPSNIFKSNQNSIEKFSGNSMGR